MFESTYTRRAMLRRGLATAGAGALVGAAGCSSDPNPLGGGGAPYANWLAVPDNLGDSDHYGFIYINLDDAEKHENKLNDASMDPSIYEDFWAPLDIDWEDASGLTILNFGAFGFGGLVVEAEFNRADITSDLKDEDFDDDSDHEGYTLMLDASESQVYAVGDGAVLLTSAADTDGEPASGDTATAEAIIDAKTGQADRYSDDSEDMNTLLGELGGGSLLNGRTMEAPEDDNPESGIFDAMVAKGNRNTITGDRTKRKWVVVYESQDDVDTGDLEDWVDENDGQFDDVDDISYDQNGRTGSITGTMDTDDF